MTYASPESVFSHWSILVENLHASPLSFYEAIEAAVEHRQVPQTVRERVDHHEAGVLSAKRQYLRVTREKLTFDICAAPFGTGFFVSWWLADTKPTLGPIGRTLALFGMLVVVGMMVSGLGLVAGVAAIVVLLFGTMLVTGHLATNGEISDDFLRSLPLIGRLYERLFKPDTYFRVDSTLMFQKALHNAVLEVLDELTTANGVRALTDSDRKPVMREFYQRKAT
jgi:hypothetical protein